MATPADWQTWWDELETEEAGGAAAVVIKDEVSGDICGDGSVLKDIKTSGQAGPMPATGDKVKCHYTGTLLDGTKFDSSRDRNTPFEFSIGAGVITGWSDGVATMRKGEVADFTIQAHKAYGEGGSPPKIPPNATLKFEIELLSWKSNDGPKDVSVDKDEGVLKRLIEEAKEDKWKKPKTLSEVQANVRMKVRGGPVVIDTTAADAAPLSFVVGDRAVIRGIEEAVMSMAVGEVARFAIAPKYGFEGGADAGVVLGVIELVGFTKDPESWDLDAEQKATLAGKRKDEGNALFKGGEFERAMLRYVSAIAKFGNNNEPKDAAEAELLVPCHLNKAACLLKLGRPGAAVVECDHVLKMDPNSVKGLYRKGCALTDLGEYEDAKAALRGCLALAPANKAAKVQLAKVKKVLAEESKKLRGKFAGMFDKFASEEAEPAKADGAKDGEGPAAE